MKKQAGKIRVSWSEPDWVYGAMGKKSAPKNPNAGETWKKKWGSTGGINIHPELGEKPPSPVYAEKLIADEKRGRYSGAEKLRLLLDFDSGQIGSGKDCRIQVGKVHFYLYYDKPVWEVRIKIRHRTWKVVKGFSARDAIENAIKSRWMYSGGQWWSLDDLMRVTILLPGDSEGRKTFMRSQKFSKKIRVGIHGAWAWYIESQYGENRLAGPPHKPQAIPEAKTAKAHYSVLAEATIERAECEGEGSAVPTFASGREPEYVPENETAETWQDIQRSASRKLAETGRNIDLKPLPIPEFSPEYDQPVYGKITKIQKPSPEAYRKLASGDVVVKPEQENLSRYTFVNPENIPAVSKAERLGIRPFKSK